MESKFRFACRTTKRRPASTMVVPQRAVTLFNDGSHLYVKGPKGVLEHIPFSQIRRDVPCNFVSGFAFPEPGVLFKSFGHTLNRTVVVLLRHHGDNWSLNLAIGAGVTATVFDFGSYISAVLEK